ncbi:hypothetical protein [Actinomadura sp. WMMB 499]|uniref:hypothetical protein n=1 Tax=Actinomadura sp. WMMB 499 TaxID=1219491 RepID=UPI001246B475|nr:hypothetical protein [Actinomadura sp. WMMB 499]QFG23809.1 hypothetical protein F7P10_24490 [Actinomadura sp. WMMB 499]
MLSVTVLGGVLIAAGLAVPAAGEATTGARGGVTVDPGMARPGDEVKVSVPGCSAGTVSSPAFERVRLDEGAGSAIVRTGTESGTHTVRVRCGDRAFSGEFRVTSRLTWPPLLPAE